MCRRFHGAQAVPVNDDHRIVAQGNLTGIACAERSEPPSAPTSNTPLGGGRLSGW